MPKVTEPLDCTPLWNNVIAGVVCWCEEQHARTSLQAHASQVHTCVVLQQVCGGICFAIGAGLQAGGQNVAMLFVGRLILGGGIGFANQVGSAKPAVHVWALSWSCLPFYGLLNQQCLWNAVYCLSQCGMAFAAGRASVHLG